MKGYGRNHHLNDLLLFSCLGDTAEPIPFSHCACFAENSETPWGQINRRSGSKVFCKNWFLGTRALTPFNKESCFYKPTLVKNGCGPNASSQSVSFSFDRKNYPEVKQKSLYVFFLCVAFLYLRKITMHASLCTSAITWIKIKLSNDPQHAAHTEDLQQ